MKVVWLAPYDIFSLGTKLNANRKVKLHPCSWIYNLAITLSINKEIELHLINASPYINNYQYIFEQNIHFHLTNSGLPGLKRSFTSLIPIDKIIKNYFVVNRILSLIKKIQPDFVHSFGTETLYGLVNLKVNIPNILSVQGIMNEFFKEKNTLSMHLAKKLELEQIKKIKNFFCRTHFDSGFVHRYNDKAKIYDVPEAINPVYFENDFSNNNNHNILFVGSLEHRKGLDVLLRALRIVKNYFDDFKLFIVGSGSEKYIKEIKILINNLTLENNILFLGFLNYNQLIKIYSESQIFVLPSRAENSPNTLVEAMASGLKVIAAEVGGVASLVDDGKNGILFQYENHEMLAEKIIFLFTNQDAGSNIAKNAKLKTSINKPDYVAELTITAYKEIIANHDVVVK